MPGALLWGWDNTNKVWIPLQVDTNGYVKVDLSNVKLNDLANVSVAAPADDDLFYYDQASGLWKSRKLADGDIPAGIARDAEVTALLAALPWSPAIYTTQIPWVSKDGFTETVPAGGSIAVGVWSVVIETGAILNNNCGLYSTYGFNLPFPAGKETTIELPLSWLQLVTNQRAVMFFIRDTAYPPTETLAHVGFIIDNGDLYSSSADGITQETQDTGVNLAAGSQLTFCKVEVIGGVSAKFYVNNVLKTTHTTKVPAAATTWCALNMGIKTLDAVNKRLGVERIIITKEI